MWCCTCAVTLTPSPESSGDTAPFLAPPARIHAIPTILTIYAAHTPCLHLAGPHPSALKGLLSACEAELGMRGAGPDPLVSPRLQGSDCMENEAALTEQHWTHWHNIKMSYISFELLGSMGASCAANKVSAICAILFQRGSCYREKRRLFSSPERTHRASVWRAPFWEQKKKKLFVSSFDSVLPDSD